MMGVTSDIHPIKYLVDLRSVNNSDIPAFEAMHRELPASRPDVWITTKNRNYFLFKKRYGRTDITFYHPVFYSQSVLNSEYYRSMHRIQQHFS